MSYEGFIVESGNGHETKRKCDFVASGVNKENRPERNQRRKTFQNKTIQALSVQALL